MKSSIKKTLKIVGIVLGSLVLIMVLLPYIFPRTINRKIDKWINSNINGNISFSSSGLSFFKHFPGLTLTMYDVALKGSAPFEKDTLIAAKEIALGIDVFSVFNTKITINKLFLNNAFLNIEVDTSGRANYNIYREKKQNTSEPEDTNSSASLGINKIVIENSRLVYNDQSLPMLLNASGFYYSGSGDLTKDVFDLNTHTEIQSIDFYYNNQPYVIGKKINADLVTQINTRSLTFIFEKNSLMINQLPVEFKGRFGFIKDGYDMSFNFDSHENDIGVIISALPAEYQKMFEKTEIKGVGSIQATLAGKYVVKDSLAPDFSISFKVRDGFISNDKSPSPVKNLYIDIAAKLPGLDPDSLTVNMDSLYFNVADGYLSSVIRVKGLKAPDIYAKINSEIDLEKWDNAVGLKPFHVKGKFGIHLLADGRYATTIEHSGIRKKQDTVITSIPEFTLHSSFKDGYFKYTKLPEAINHICFDLTAECRDHDYKHINMSVDSITVTALDNYIKGALKLGNMSDFPVSALLQARFHLDDLKKFYPTDGFDLKGDLEANITANGNYEPKKKRYPEMDAKITMLNGYVKTKYYPNAIEDIQVNTAITDKTGDLRGLNVSIQPITFRFENEPFLAKADLQDFDNLRYNVNLQGILDIGRIYKVFAIKGYNVTGSVAANLTMKGRQSDASAGHYDKLYNKGSLKIRNITCTAELYPKPFFITRGVFSFVQDKMQFDTFAVRYAGSEFVLNGAVSNVIDYIMKKHAILKGDFNLSSNDVAVDDFMAFADTSRHTHAAAAGSKSAGVVMVPKNLNVSFTANIKNVRYTDILLKDATGQMTINNGILALKQTGFVIIDAPVTMEADYTSVTPQKARFNYHITASNFDVHKAYTKIKLFHDLVSSAASAQGLISLDYKLSGDLNSGMMPVYTSLKGGGLLTASKIKMRGFRLFGAIGKKTGRDSLSRNPDVSKVKIKSTIANNIIDIETTKLRVAIFRARFCGRIGFNKKLDLKFRLGLPPLGIIGIPMAITGTEDKPNVRFRKEKKEEEIDAAAETDE